MDSPCPDRESGGMRGKYSTLKRSCQRLGRFSFEFLSGAFTPNAAHCHVEPFASLKGKCREASPGACHGRSFASALQETWHGLGGWTTKKTQSQRRRFRGSMLVRLDSSPSGSL